MSAEAFEISWDPCTSEQAEQDRKKDEDLAETDKNRRAGLVDKHQAEDVVLKEYTTENPALQSDEILSIYRFESLHHVHLHNTAAVVSLDLQLQLWPSFM